jgi:hypothetical protein
MENEKVSAPAFCHTPSVNLLYSYLRDFLYSYFYDLIQILIKNILTNNRALREKLEKNYASLEELEQTIRVFDSGLSPDAEDGKLFHRLRHSMAADPNHQKMFRNLVIQKDRDIKALISEGLDSLSGLSQTMDELLNSPGQGIKTQLGAHYMVQGQSTPLTQLLETRVEHLTRFRNLFLQIYKKEKENRA